MKNLFLLCAFLFTLPAVAQVPGPSVHFGIQGDIINANLSARVKQITGLPASGTPFDIALEEVYGFGFGGGVHLDIDLGLITVRVAGDYLTLTANRDKFTGPIRAAFPGSNVLYVAGGRINIITGTVSAKLMVLPLPVFKPYITAGGGVANVSTTAIDLNFNGNPVRPYEVLQKQTVGTIKAGVGADFSLVGLTLFAEIQVNKIFFKEGSGSFVPIGTVGLTF